MVGTSLISGGRTIFPSRAVCIILLLSLNMLALSASPAKELRFLTNAGVRPPAPQNSLPGESPTRLRIDLNGEWSYAIEGGASGTVPVPSAYDFQGKVVFQRRLHLSEDVIAKYRFRFVGLGISQYADVTINNDLIAEHAGGYTAIDQPIPAHCLQSESENVIRVVVSNILDPRRTFPVQPYPAIGRNYGGITRDVYLLGIPETSIRDAVVGPEIDERNGAVRLQVRVTIDRDNATVPEKSLGCIAEVYDRVTGVIIGRSTVQTVEGGQGGSVQQTLVVPVQGLRAWSPDNPELYTVRCSLIPLHGDPAPIDVYDVSWGLRDFSIQKGNFLVGGSRIVLKGVIWNEDHPAYGSALSFEQMEKDVALIKTLGANAIRFAGHPPHPYMLDLCDRYGLFALVDLPLSGVPGPIIGDTPFHELAANGLREMIQQNINHPSVICWGIGDGLDVSDPATRDGLSDLVALARSLDSRYLYSPTNLMTPDLCTGLMDIAAVKIHTTDVKAFRAELDAWKSANAGKPVIVAWFGSEVQEGNRKGSNDPFSQESQARFYLQRFDILKATNFDGGILSSFNDWQSARASLTVHSGDPWLESMGLVNGNREKRLAFEAVRAAMHGEKFAALPLGSYSNKAPIVYVLSGFAFLVGIVYLYNRNRRFHENLNRSLLSGYNFFADIRDQHGVAMTSTFLLGLGTAAGVGLMVSSLAFHFRENPVADRALSILLILDPLKAAVVRVIWDPLLAIGLVAAGAFLGLFLLTGGILLLRMFFRQRISASQALAVSFWSTAPLLLFIPFGMIAYRVMDSTIYVLPISVFFVLMFVWAALRLIKGLAIVFDVRPARMYLLGFLFCLAVFAGFYVAFYSGQSLPEYARFLYHAATRTV